MDQTTPRDHTSRMQAIALLLVLLWSVYCLNGFRPPTQAIELSDADAGSALRQALFGGSALLSAVLLWMNRTLWPSIRTHWSWCLFAVWVLLSVLYTEQTGTTLKRAVLLCCGLTTAVFAVSTLTKRPLVGTVWTIAGICAGVSVMSLVWMIALPAEITTNPGRPGLAGISNHPNTLAPACAIGCALFCVLQARTRLAIAAKGFGFVSCLVALILTGSVTSLFLALVGMSIAILIVLGGYAGVISGVLLFSGVVAITIMGPAAVSEMIFQSVDRDPSMSGRDQLWAIIWEQVQIHPLFGHGWGAFWTEGKGRELVQSWNPRQSHNAFLDIMLDIGFVGLVILLIPITQTIMNGIKLRDPSINKDTRRAIAGGLGVVTSLLLVYGLQQSFLGKPDSFVFAVFLCIAIAISNEVRGMSSISA